MQPCKPVRTKQRLQDLCWKVHNSAQSFDLLSYTIHESRNQHVSIWLVPHYGVRVHGHDQRREQKHITKNFVEFHIYSSLLTMVRLSFIRRPLTARYNSTLQSWLVFPEINA